MLRKLANMRAAKAKKRLANPPPEPEPKLERWHRFELGIRDKIKAQCHTAKLGLICGL